MDPKSIPHYATGDFVSHASFMDEATFAAALDSLVLTCVDIVFTHGEKMLLVKRTREPQADWWIIGGRMKTGESPVQAVIRTLERETGLTVGEDRISFLTVFSAAWDKRNHLPVENGTHTVSLVHAVELAAEEVDRISLNDEYKANRWLPTTEVMTDTDLHPALQVCAQEILAKNSTASR